MLLCKEAILPILSAKIFMGSNLPSCVLCNSFIHGLTSVDWLPVVLFSHAACILGWLGDELLSCLGISFGLFSTCKMYVVIMCGCCKWHLNHILTSPEWLLELLLSDAGCVVVEWAGGELFSSLTFSSGFLSTCVIFDFVIAIIITKGSLTNSMACLHAANALDMVAMRSWFWALSLFIFSRAP